MCISPPASVSSRSVRGSRHFHPATRTIFFFPTDPFGNMPDTLIDVTSLTNIRRYNDTLSLHTLDCTTTAAGSTQPQQLAHDRVGLCTGFSLQYNLGLLARCSFFSIFLHGRISKYRAAPCCFDSTHLPSAALAPPFPVRSSVSTDVTDMCSTHADPCLRAGNI